MWTRLRPARATRPRGAQHVTTASDTGGLLDRAAARRRASCRRAVGRAAPRGASACARARVRRPRPRLERARPATSNERYQRRRRRTRRRRRRKRKKKRACACARAASEAAPWANAPGDKQSKVPLTLWEGTYKLGGPRARGTRGSFLQMCQNRALGVGIILAPVRRRVPE
ncbi:unnamed protein product [Prorocentrum cordatum]|uniref:Uncharacterized protein n=1 Tax=Prorocentrum cordatum TaxID=2364126 RepID=A0ABN9VFE9_9DINO|nr:unnamed protein product [Polarella glacialis]